MLSDLRARVEFIIKALLSLTVHVALLQALGVPDAAIEKRLKMQRPYQDWSSYRR